MEVARLSADSADPRPDRRLLMDASFAAGQVSSLRQQVARHVVQAGLTEQAADDFVLAVNEAMSNAIRHGGGRGLIRLWRADGLVCEIIDRGPGFTADKPTMIRHRPEPSPSGGLGLWLAQQLCESLDIDTGPDGTTVRVSAALPDPVTGRRGDRPTQRGGGRRPA